MSKIYEIYGTDAHEMTKALMGSADIAEEEGCASMTIYTSDRDTGVKASRA